jgi:hypothetical protein
LGRERVAISLTCAHRVWLVCLHDNRCGTRPAGEGWNLVGALPAAGRVTRRRGDASMARQHDRTHLTDHHPFDAHSVPTVPSGGTIGLTGGSPIGGNAAAGV